MDAEAVAVGPEAIPSFDRLRSASSRLLLLLLERRRSVRSAALCLRCHGGARLAVCANVRVDWRLFQLYPEQHGVGCGTVQRISRELVDRI
jgi:hypothetical protein